MTDHTQDQTDNPDGGEKLSIGLIITIALSAIVVIFILSNNHDVPVKFISFDATMPMWAIIFIAVFAGMAIAWSLGALRRRGQRKTAKQSQ